MLSLKILTHYLLSRRSGALIRTISWLCIVGVCIGVMSLMIVISVMNGFQGVQKKRHLRAEPHLVVHYRGEEADFPSWYRKLKSLVDKQFQIQLDEMSPYEQMDVIVKTAEGSFSGAVAKGMSADALNSFFKRLDLSMRITDRSLRDIYFGADLARSLNVYSGDEVILIPPEEIILAVDELPRVEKVPVAATYATNLQDIDTRTILFVKGQGLNRFVNSTGREQGAEIRLVDGDNYFEPTGILKSAGFEVTTWPERNSALFFALKMEKLVMTTFLSLSALITGFSIITVLILLITQKRRDIGVLMALGMTPKETRRLFARVGLWLASFGVGAGLLFGVTVCWFIDRFPMDILPEIYQDTSIPAKVSGTMVAVILISSTILALLGAWLPAHLAAGNQPAAALRS